MSIIKHILVRLILRFQFTIDIQINGIGCILNEEHFLLLYFVLFCF